MVHVLAFLGLRQTQSDTAEIVGSHGMPRFLPTPYHKHIRNGIGSSSGLVSAITHPKCLSRAIFEGPMSRAAKAKSEHAMSVELLHQLADVYGVQTAYHRISGELCQASPDALLVVLRVLGAPVQRLDD